MCTGTLKWFNTRKGYGFIKPVDGGFDVYVHVSAIEHAGIGDLKEGQKINFEIVVDQVTGEVRAENLSAWDSGPEIFDQTGEPGRVPPALPFAGLLPGLRASRLAGTRRA